MTTRLGRWNSWLTGERPIFEDDLDERIYRLMVQCFVTPPPLILN